MRRDRSRVAPPMPHLAWQKFFEIAAFRGTGPYLPRVGCAIEEPLRFRQRSLAALRALDAMPRRGDLTEWIALGSAITAEHVSALRTEITPREVVEIERFVREELIGVDPLDRIWGRVINFGLCEPSNAPPARLDMPIQFGPVLVGRVCELWSTDLWEAELKVAARPSDEDDRWILSTYESGLTPAIFVSAMLWRAATRKSWAIITEAQVDRQQILAWGRAIAATLTNRGVHLDQVRLPDW